VTVTEDQQLASIESLAIELNRLAHAAPTPGDEQDCSNVAVIVRSMDRLCLNAREALAKITYYLCQIAAHEHDDGNREKH
jgi:hypothetical protein